MSRVHSFRILFETVCPCNHFISKYNPIRVREKRVINERSLLPGVDKWQLPDCFLSTIIIIHGNSPSDTMKLATARRGSGRLCFLSGGRFAIPWLAIIVSNPIVLTDNNDECHPDTSDRTCAMPEATEYLNNRLLDPARRFTSRSRLMRLLTICISSSFLYQIKIIAKYFLLRYFLDKFWINFFQRKNKYDNIILNAILLQLEKLYMITYIFRKILR